MDGEAEASERVASVRRRYHDATHVCWAFRLAAGVSSPGEDPAAPPRDGPLERWSDAGEPSGTAGVPLLGALQRSGVFQALVVVTRYFGGTKLGTGGLVRAYGGAAAQAVDAAPRRVLWRATELTVSCGYEVLGAVEAVLRRFSGSLPSVRREFDEGPLFRIRVHRSLEESLRSALREATRGDARIQP
jgi:uncharacterized YigZ family protein